MSVLATSINTYLYRSPGLWTNTNIEIVHKVLMIRLLKAVVWNCSNPKNNQFISNRVEKIVIIRTVATIMSESQINIRYRI